MANVDPRSPPSISLTEEELPSQPCVSYMEQLVFTSVCDLDNQVPLGGGASGPKRFGVRSRILKPRYSVPPEAVNLIHRGIVVGMDAARAPVIGVFHDGVGVSGAPLDRAVFRLSLWREFMPQTYLGCVRVRGRRYGSCGGSVSS